MQMFEELHAAREPQFGHPCYLVLNAPETFCVVYSRGCPAEL